MKNSLFLIVGISFTIQIHAQTYTHPTIGIGSEYVGACETATCTGTYYDDGGASGNYSDDINAIYRVFCPNTAGNCVRLTFNSFDVQDLSNAGFYRDFLTIGNGATQNSPLFITTPADLNGRIYGTPAVPFSYTSTHSSGCLTSRFTSNGNSNRTGWSATLSCIPCAGGPNGIDNNDCIRAMGLCSNASIPGNSTGPGIVAEGCNGTACPAGGENHTNWYTFQAATSGLLNITVTPTVGTDDYDFALFGPNPTCGSLGSPLRCSDSGATGTTGTSSTSFDFTENVSGDKYVASLTVVAGQSFIMMVDEWTPTGAGYTLSFSGAANLDCTVLPIELTDFYASYVPEEDVVDVHWNTASERNNDYFTLEKSYNGLDFFEVGIVDGAGNTNYETQYYVNDPENKTGVIYYRLKQTDVDGEFDFSKVVSVNIFPELKNEMVLFPNPTKNTTEAIFTSSIEQIAHLSITDSKGFLVEKSVIQCRNGSNSVDIDLTDKSSGIYFITITTGEYTLYNKLLKE
jgi:hypothetical protein